MVTYLLGMSLWYVARLTTYLDLASVSRFEDPVQLQVKSYISKKQFSKLQHLANYISCHNAMAYDSGKHAKHINICYFFITE
jgi:hypothetical protein